MASDSMFALRKEIPGPGLKRVEGLPIPKLDANEVLIAVSLAGICGTDRHIYEWDDWAQGRVRPPVTIGHEFVGRVVEVGIGCRRISSGMRVSGEGHVGCGRCEPCRTGRGHICEKVQVIGIDRDGSFAQYLVLPEDNVWPLNEDIPDKVAAIMDPLGNAMHTVMAADVSGRNVLITGVGVIGLMAVAIAKRAGAGRIIAVDLEQRHLDRARELGADHLLRADDPDWWKQARALTHDNQGPECWLEMSGAASAIRDGFKALRNGGAVSLLGLPRKPMEVDLADGIIFKGATVRGISGRLMYETWFQMEGFLAGAGLSIESLVTHVYPVDEYADAFDTVATGEAIKVLLEFPSVGA